MLNITVRSRSIAASAVCRNVFIQHDTTLRIPAQALFSTKVVQNYPKTIIAHDRRLLSRHPNQRLSLQALSVRHLAAVHRRNHYEVLGVARNASTKEIKRAYIELAKRYHPDANPGNEEASTKFQEVAAAYTVLSSRQQRDAYDGVTTGSQSAAPDFDPLRRSTYAASSSFQESFHSSVDPEALFRKIFGAEFDVRKAKATTRDRTFTEYAPTDANAPSDNMIVRLSFREAAKGCEKMITAKAVCTCEACMGLGANPGKPIQLCPFCDGTGIEIVDGVDERFRTTCRFCLGKGHNVVHKCPICMGFGKELKDRTMCLPIPAGIADGETIKVNVAHHQDDQDIGSGPGQTIFVTFRVDPSDYFRIDEENPIDLHTDAEISLAQAIFGGRIKVDGLYSDEFIRIQPGTDSHFAVRLEGKGLKKTRGHGYGDHYVHLRIVMPKNLTSEQRRLLRAYAEIESNTRGEIDGIDKKKKADTEETKDSAAADEEAGRTKHEHDYAGVDFDIDEKEREQMINSGGNQGSPWRRMARDLISPPVSLAGKIFKAYTQVFFNSKK